MIDISEIVATWPVVDGWRISPGVEWCADGRRVRVGANCKAGDGFVAGDGFRAGDNARPIAALGIVDGYVKSLCAVGDVAYIGAGCRWMTLADAFRHWSNHDRDRRMTLCLLEAARAMAKLHELREE